MKKFSMILLGICMLVFMGACAHQSGLPESEKIEVVVDVVKSLDEDAIKPHITIEDLMSDNWENIASDPSPQQRFIDFYLVNKDFSAEIQYSVVRFVPSYNTVIGYAYMLKNKIYVFQRDGVGGYKSADLRDIDVEWWIEQFKKYFLSEDNSQGC